MTRPRPPVVVASSSFPLLLLAAVSVSLPDSARGILFHLNRNGDKRCFEVAKTSADGRDDRATTSDIEVSYEVNSATEEAPDVVFLATMGKGESEEIVETSHAASHTWTLHTPKDEYLCLSWFSSQTLIYSHGYDYEHVSFFPASAYLSFFPDPTSATVCLVSHASHPQIVSFDVRYDATVQPATKSQANEAKELALQLEDRVARILTQQEFAMTRDAVHRYVREGSLSYPHFFPTGVRG